MRWIVVTGNALSVNIISRKSRGSNMLVDEVVGNIWQALDLGDAAVALGKGASAAGAGSTALGMFTSANGLGSIAAGGDMVYLSFPCHAVIHHIVDSRRPS